jgi:O-antigen/teichoic acid export membrane protein
VADDSVPASARRLATESAAYAAVDAGQNLVALLVVPASLFWLTPSDMGTVTLALLASQIAMTGAALGLDFALIRFYLRWPAEERAARARGLLGICTTWALAISAAATIGASVFGAPLGPAVAAATVAGAGLGVRAIPVAALRVESRFVSYAAIAIGASLLQGALQIAALAFGMGVQGFLVAFAVSAWASAVAAVGVARRAGSGALLPEASVVRLAGLNLAAGLVNRLVAGADRLAMAAWTSLDSLGVYGTAARWTLPLRTVSGATKLALAPALTRDEAAGEDSATAAVAPLVSSLCLLAGCLQLSTWLLVLTPWSAVLPDVQRLLAVLVLAQVAGSLALIEQTVLYYRGRSARSTGLAVLSGALTLAGLVWLVPRFGATGAAFAQLGANGGTLAVLLVMADDTRWVSSRLGAALAVLAMASAGAWLLGPVGRVCLTLAGSVILGILAWWDWRGTGWSLRLGST